MGTATLTEEQAIIDEQKKKLQIISQFKEQVISLVVEIFTRKLTGRVIRKSNGDEGTELARFSLSNACLK